MKKVNKHFGMHITAACFKQSGQHMLKQERRQIMVCPSFSGVCVQQRYFENYSGVKIESSVSMFKERQSFDHWIPY